MILPRRLFLTADGKFCEADDTRQVKNFHPAGYPIPDAEAEKIGLKAYLDETGWGDVARAKDAPEEKAVAQAQTEDKAVEPPDDKPAGGLRIEGPPADAEDRKDDPKAKQDDEPGPGLHIDRGAGPGRGRRS